MYKRYKRGRSGIFGRIKLLLLCLKFKKIFIKNFYKIKIPNKLTINPMLITPSQKNQKKWARIA